MTDHENELLLKTFVDAFLACPLPDSVCSDPCVTMPGYPHRSGTNLLTADQATQMFSAIFRSTGLSRQLLDHENELDRLGRKNIELRQSNSIMANCIKNVISNLESPPRSTFQAQWVTEKAIQILRAAVERSDNSTATDTAGSDYISKAVSDEMAKQILASAAMTEELRQKVFILRFALGESYSPRQDCRNSEACLCVRCSAMRRTKLDGEPLDYISKESVKPLVDAAVANHKWHEENDDYGGYPESDLCELNCKAIAVAKSIGIPTEKEGG